MKFQLLIIPVLIVALLGGAAAYYFYTRETPLPIAGKWGNETLLLRFFEDGRLTYKSFEGATSGRWSQTGEEEIQLIYEWDDKLIKDKMSVNVTEETLSLMKIESSGEGSNELLLAKDHPGPSEEIRHDFKSTEAEVTVLQLASRLSSYEIKYDMLPSTEQGLNALVARPTILPIPENWEQSLAQIPADPWGRPFRYTYYPSLNGRSGTNFDIWSAGPDGKDNTADDVGNWN